MKLHQFILFFGFLFVNLSLNAQTKYEFMIIEYNRSLKKEIVVSIDGKEFLQEKSNFQGQEESFMNATPILVKIKEYQDKGWELMNLEVILNPNSVMGRNYFAYLKKKME